LEGRGFAERGGVGMREKSFTLFVSVFVENQEEMHMINIFLIFRIL
jgi:hypothetical protein